MKTPLTTLPRFASLMFRAALKRDNMTQLPPTFDDLPKQPLSFAPAHLFDSSIEQFHAVTRWQSGHLHPCYLHVVSFPMHLMLMLQKDFPFALLGLVHINNEITQYMTERFGEFVLYKPAMSASTLLLWLLPIALFLLFIYLSVKSVRKSS